MTNIWGHADLQASRPHPASLIRRDRWRQSVATWFAPGASVPDDPVGPSGVGASGKRWLHGLDVHLRVDVHVLRCDRSRGIVVEPPGSRVEESRADFVAERRVPAALSSKGTLGMSPIPRAHPLGGQATSSSNRESTPGLPMTHPVLLDHRQLDGRDDALLPPPRASLDHVLISVGCSGTARDAEESSASREQ